MRVYEIAKQEGLSSKDILDLLKKGGFDSYCHVSVLQEDALSYLKKTLTGLDKSNIEPKKRAIEGQPVSEKDSSIASRISPDRARVDDSLSRVVKTAEKEVVIEGEMALFRAAEIMGKSSGELIMSLMKKGMVCNRNHILSVDVIFSLGQEFGFNVVLRKQEGASFELKESTEGGKSRWPIVVVMGHVDHGKTTLLDFIRKTRVALKERGGITQHLGAYEVDSSHGKIIFLDTPGHAAFSHMRKRGATVTDIVILVVAADDGVMPQTVEAIKCARAAGVPILVAINKIDKVDGPTPIERVKRQLAQHDLVPEDWGGEVVCVPISAKEGKGVDELLEMVVLQTQMMELKAYSSCPAKAFVLESNMEKGHGAVATIICQRGTIKQGDYFICGGASGRVRLLVNAFGESVDQAGPSIPVKVVGFNILPLSGETLEVVSCEEYQKNRFLRPEKRKGLWDGAGLEVEEANIIRLVVKCDTFGTSEAVLGSIKLLSKKYKEKEGGIFKVIHIGVGDVSEGDVALAIDTKSLIVGMNVKVEKNATVLAREAKVIIVKHQIIYRLIEELEVLLKKKQKVKVSFKKIGKAVVLKIFDIKGKGIITGACVKEGFFSKDGKVTCIRNGEVAGEGKISSLQKERKSIAEVQTGTEFAFFCREFQDWQVDDIIECSLEETKKNKE